LLDFDDAIDAEIIFAAIIAIIPAVSRLAMLISAIFATIIAAQPHCAIDTPLRHDTIDAPLMSCIAFIF